MASMRDERAVAPCEHHVQLFDSSKSLVETVSAFLIAGFHRGEPLLIVATPPHRELLTRCLESQGVDVRRGVAVNRIAILDAEQTLDRFMRQDAPSPIAFDE